MTAWTEASRSASRKTADEHALVLEALGIPSGHAHAFGLHVVLVPVEDAERARAELAKYVQENREAPQPEVAAPALHTSVGAALGYVIVLLALDALQRRGSFGLDWWSAGMASAGMIRDGAWWRAVTALTLHSDFLHLAGNLVFGAAFGVMLAQSVGFGLAWLAFVATGAIGNGLNAWLQAPSHSAVGASTAVFGMLGVLVAHDWVRRRQLHYNLFRRWAPIAIGAALLAWLGGDGKSIDPNSLPETIKGLNVPVPRIDVWGHVLGFSCGLVLGGLIGWRLPRARLRPAAQTALAVAALSILVLAWWLALR